MRIALVALLALTASAQDASEIIRRSLDRDHLNFEHLKNYTYQEHAVVRQYDGKGKLKKTEIETNEVLILGGRPYVRLIAKDDKPLPEKQQQKEQEKMDREVARRQHESEYEKAKLEKRRAEGRKFLNEFSQAFNFRVLGEDNVSGQPAWIIEAEPKAGYRPQESLAKVFPKVRGKVWIEKSGYQWVKAEGEAIEPISFGLFLFRVAPGGTLKFEQTRVNNEVWLPARVTIRAEARVALLKHMRGEVDITYREYKKFQADSKLIAGEAAKP